MSTGTATRSSSGPFTVVRGVNRVLRVVSEGEVGSLLEKKVRVVPGRVVGIFPTQATEEDYQDPSQTQISYYVRVRRNILHLYLATFLHLKLI